MSQRQRVVEWSEHHQILIDHIINGRCRGLYPQSVAEIAIKALVPVLDIETNKLKEEA